MGRTLKQVGRLCVPSTPPLDSIKRSEPTYGSINLLNTNEDNDTLVGPLADADPITADNENNLICEKDLNNNNYRLCRAKTAHDAVLGKVYAFLPFRKTLTATEAPRLDTRALITNVDVVAKRNDKDVSTILAQQIQNQVPTTVQSRLLKGIAPDAKSPKNQ